ncbi:hypothetical protein U1Q18_025042 [Sarracenia purpurea var. burkii]
MEHTISSLAYKGSIVEAIAEAKGQKKLFVVYISGDNAESTHLEESTWMDSNVAECISKYCILLHISEKSTDAANFSAIYPQKCAPCITAIGYNGVKVWQNDGFVSADILASSLEKAWLSLHVQETTATFLITALASKKFEPHGASSSDTVSFEQRSSSSMDVPSTTTDKHAQYSRARIENSSEIEHKGSDQANEGVNSKLCDEQSTSSIETAEESLMTVKVDDPCDTGVSNLSSVARDECTAPGADLNVVDHHSEVPPETSQVISNKATEAVQDKNTEALEGDKIDLEITTVTSQEVANKATEAVQDKNADAIGKDKIDVLDSCLNKSTDVHLNIRLLDGSSIKGMFLVTSSLGMVKDYVVKNQTSAIGSYDLAIPYPRKVFTDQDLCKTLSELGLFGRQALILVPRGRAIGYHKERSSSSNQTTPTNDLGSSNGNNGGYLASMKGILSYLNPLSYLGGGANSSNSTQESQHGLWQYSLNHAPQNNVNGTGRAPTIYSAQQSTSATGRNNKKNKQATSTRLGSNIHTLRHDEDDSQFSDRNAFWNGNSTQYGGDNDSK